MTVLGGGFLWPLMSVAVSGCLDLVDVILVVADGGRWFPREVRSWGRSLVVGAFSGFPWLSVVDTGDVHRFVVADHWVTDTGYWWLSLVMAVIDDCWRLWLVWVVVADGYNRVGCC